MSKRTYDWNGHTDLDIACPQYSDEQVAANVRMLMRGSREHEMWCVAARDRIMCLVKENAALQAIVDKLPKRNDGTLYDDYAIGPKASGWCIWRYDHEDPWRVSHCTRGDATLGDGYPEWQICDAEDDCEVGGVYETKEAAEKAVR